MIRPFSASPSARPRAAATEAWMVVFVLCALTFGVQVSSAMVYAPISDADLFEGADRVVLGKVLDVRPAADARVPSTDYVVWVDEEFRASRSPSTITVRVPGGVGDDGLAFWIPGTPTLRVGESFLFFLDEGAGAEGNTTTRLSQHTLSLFHVVEVSGHKLAVRVLGDAAEIYLAETDGQAAKGLSRSVERQREWPRDLEGFSRWMRAGLEGEEADYQVDPKSLGSGFGDKFTLLLSRADDEFGGCGENGGRPVRRYDFDEAGAAVGWRVHFAAPPGAVNAFHEALAAWTNDPASGVNFAFDGLTSANGVLHRPDQVNAVRFDDPFDDIPGVFDGSGLLALGGPWFFCDLFDYRGEEFHLVAEGDIVVQEGVPEAFEAVPWPDRLMIQLLAHELGHTLGIGHTDDPQALMQALLHVDPRGAAFEPDDLAALEYLYGDEPGSEAPPVPPGRPDAVTDRGPFVRLSWDPVDGASNYRIEKRRPPQTWSPLTTVPETEFVDVWVDPEATYDYRLRAQNGAGASTVSPPVRIVTGPDGVPAAPSQVRAYPTDPNGIGLRWQSNFCDVETLTLSIDFGSGYQPLLDSLDGQGTEVLVTGLRSAEEYGFRLSAANHWGQSTPSEPVVVDQLGADGACTWRPGDEHLCLDYRRYEVSLEYWHRGLQAWRPAVPRPEEHHRGFFSFFDTNNLEIELSVDTDSSGTTRLRWTSLTSQAWRVAVFDTMTGESWTHEADRPLCIGSMALTAPEGSSLVSGQGESTAASNGSDWQLVNVSSVSSGTAKALPPVIPCSRASTDLYLNQGRFRARLWWWDEAGVRRPARALDLTNLSGGFELTTNDELGWVLKLLDGRGLNDKFWVFAGPMQAAAPYEAVLEISDLETGFTRTYRRGEPPPSDDPDHVPACSMADIGAFDG